MKHTSVAYNLTILRFPPIFTKNVLLNVYFGSNCIAFLSQWDKFGTAKCDIFGSQDTTLMIMSFGNEVYMKKL